MTRKSIGVPAILAALLTGCATPETQPPVSVEPKDAVLKSEFIYENAPFPACHASTIEDIPGGLIAAWFGGRLGAVDPTITTPSLMAARREALH